MRDRREQMANGWCHHLTCLPSCYASTTAISLIICGFL